MIYTIEPNIYRITVDLPGNPLRSLNSYVITGGSRNLLIDTGFNMPECLKSLKEGLKELQLDMSATDIFVTHLHSDHSGLVSKIVSPQTRVYMGAIDWDMLNNSILNPDKYWIPAEQTMIMEGYPPNELELTKLHNPGSKFESDSIFDCVSIQDGDTLPYGSGNLQCILTPGHTPGHICLYESESQTLFTGDHLLFDITPNITFWMNMPNSLERYLESLKKVSELPVKKTLTGHRENSGDFYHRIKELQLHHKTRLEDVMRIIAESPGINGYQVAARMKWSIRVKSWEDFPPGQRWFAVGEAIAHLNYLIDRDEISKKVSDGINTYTVNTPG